MTRKKYISKVQRQKKNWQKILSVYISDDRFTSLIHTLLLETEKKKRPRTQQKKKAKDTNNSLTER